MATVARRPALTGEAEERSPVEAAKRIRLIGPIEKATRPRIAVEMMLGLEVIADDTVDRIGRDIFGWNSVQRLFSTHMAV